MVNPRSVLSRLILLPKVSSKGSASLSYRGLKANLVKRPFASTAIMTFSPPMVLSASSRAGRCRVLAAPWLTMTASVQTMGRETPYKLNYIASTQQLLVVYADAAMLYQRDENLYQPVGQAEQPSLAAELLPGREGDWKLILAGAGSLTLLDHHLNTLHSVVSDDEEDTQALLALREDSFLSTSETSAVSCWAVPPSEAPAAAYRWPVECQPLWAANSGKVVVCAERGRLQDRDPLNGTVLRTWPKSAPIHWAAGDEQEQHLLAVDETGRAWMWDRSSRECLFSLDSDFSVSRGIFSSTGLSGALLGTEGEVATFRVVEGGSTTSVPTPDSAIVALTYADSTLIGLDENGGLWSLDQGQPQRVGGEWAGWATSTLSLSDSSLLIGTANGTVEQFQDSKHMTSTQVHHDAVIGLEAHDNSILSIGADAVVAKLSQKDGQLVLEQTVYESPGRFVVDYLYFAHSRTLCLALDEGLLTWFQVDVPEEKEELQLEERRVEELNPAGPGSILVLTDRGSVRRVKLV